MRTEEGQRRGRNDRHEKSNPVWRLRTRRSTSFLYAILLLSSRVLLSLLCFPSSTLRFPTFSIIFPHASSQYRCISFLIHPSPPAISSCLQQFFVFQPHSEILCFAPVQQGAAPLFFSAFPVISSLYQQQKGSANQKTRRGPPRLLPSLSRSPRLASKEKIQTANNTPLQPPSNPSISV